MTGIWKVVAAFVGVFIAGSVFGGFFAIGFNRPPTPARPVAATPIPDFTPQLIQSYSRELHLNDEQRKAIEPAVRLASEKLAEIRKTELQASFAVLQPLNEEFRRILTPDQLARLEDYERRQRFMGQRGGPDRGGRGGPPPGIRNQNGGGRGRGEFRPPSGSGAVPSTPVEPAAPSPSPASPPTPAAPAE